MADVNPDNVERLISDVDLILDGTDNFETRFLINDVCVKHGLPWVYGGVIATYGMVRAIVPHRTPCFRCSLAEMPVPGSTPTCDTVGVLSSAVNVIASLEVVAGDAVERGQTIGRTGATGLAGGDHLHFGVFLHGVATDPVEWFDADWIRNRVASKLERDGSPA